MIGCLRTPVRKQPIIALYFEFENEHKFITSRPGLQFCLHMHFLYLSDIVGSAP